MSEAPTEQRIRILPDGPYLVVDAVPLTERYPAESRHGEPLAWDPVRRAGGDGGPARHLRALPVRAVGQQALL